MTLNSLLVQVPLNMVLVVGIPLALIYVFNKLDKEMNGAIKPKKRDIIIIVAVSILYTIASTILLNDYLGLWINTSMLIGYLIFCSYTDLKTKLLYAITSIAFLIIEVVWLIIDYKSAPINNYTWTILVVLAILLLMAIPRWLGLGDSLLYCVIATYLVHYRFVPTMSLIINLLFTNIMFVIVTVIVKIVRHNKEKHQPLTLFIAISTAICCLLGV